MFEVSGPHTGAMPYQVVEGDQAICDCWIEGDAHQIADALNAQGARLSRLESQFVNEHAESVAAERAVRDAKKEVA